MSFNLGYINGKSIRKVISKLLESSISLFITPFFDFISRRGDSSPPIVASYLEIIQLLIVEIFLMGFKILADAISML